MRRLARTPWSDRLRLRCNVLIASQFRTCEPTLPDERFAFSTTTKSTTTRERPRKRGWHACRLEASIHSSLQATPFPCLTTNHRVAQQFRPNNPGAEPANPCQPHPGDPVSAA